MVLVAGVGFNDMRGKTSYWENGERVRLTSYMNWKEMLFRAYGEKRHKYRPTYKGCTVCAEWLTFSNFKSWHECNYVPGWDLDKDLMSPDNKEYSPDTCVYIPPEINAFLSCRMSNRGQWPLGVTRKKKTGRYAANISCNGIPKHLGYYSTPEQAHEIWHREKLLQACAFKEVCDSINNKVFCRLIAAVNNLKEETNNVCK